MKKLMSSRPSGLAIIEVILVMTISALLFGVVIGTFATRRKAASDDAARQVMSEIARVRNQAQQGQGATTTAGATALAGNEMFGQAIMLSNDSSTITVYKLMQSRISPFAISSYENYTINMPANLRWFITSGTTASDYCAITFTSCYNDIRMGGVSPQLLPPYIVFRNNTGQSYVLSASAYTSLANYTTPSQQGRLRLAFGIKGPGASIAAEFAAAPNKYYANFDLAKPNNQSLQVVK